MSTLFIGVDAGGTGTRALVATDAGEVVGSGTAGGANSWSSGSVVSEVVLAAIGDALRASDAGSVDSGVIAMAGGGATSKAIGAKIAAGWESLGLRGAPVFVLDVVAAFAAGTAGPDGIVVAAGTGSIAAAIHDHDLVRRVGGHGWLVGDEGSAVWLGIEGTRAALHALDGRGEMTTLASLIPEALGIRTVDAVARSGAIVEAIYGVPPARMGQLAPVVVEAAEQGDTAARDLVAEASDHLVALASAVASEDAPVTVVLAGSLLTRVNGIAGPVRSALARHWPDADIVEAVSGAAGSVALVISRSRFGPLDAAAFERLRADSLAATANLGK